MTTTLTIRADCSPTLGTGHVMRMIALGQAWQDIGGTVQFVGETAALNDRLTDEGFAVIPVPAVHPDKSDLETLLAHTKPNDWIAIDGYHFDTDYQKAVRQAGRRTLVMDDICDRGEYHADILLNQNGDAEEYAYDINPDATLLLGTKYVLLRKEFLDHSTDNRNIPAKANNILVTLGGADPSNMTARILEALAYLGDNELHIRIVAGAANPHFSELQKRCLELPGSHELLSNISDMPPIMNWAHLAISGAGSTCWELCFLKIPLVAIVIANNQQGIGQTLKSQGVAPVLDTDTTVEDIATMLKDLIHNNSQREIMIAKGRQLVDGQGAARVANTLYCTDIHLRPALEKDCTTLLDWRNNPAVRTRSFSSDIIGLDEHTRWFLNKLSSDDCLLFIAEDGSGFPVGQIRFDRNGDEALVSISVIPSTYGKGIGTVMTKQGCSALANQWPGIKVLAQVKPDNPASAAMFKKAGFSKTENLDSDYLQFEWTDCHDQ